MASSTPQQSDSGQQERYTHGYSSEITQFLASRTALKEAAFFLPHISPGIKLLDCGCGPGTITTGLAEIISSGEVIGIDLNANQIDQAYKYATEKGVSNAHFDIGNIYELPFSDNSFDAVFCHAVLHHLNEPIKALREIRRVLKPRGVVGVRAEDREADLSYPSNPLLEQAHALYMKLWKESAGDPYFPRRFRAALREAGFSNIKASASSVFRGTPEETQRWGDALEYVFIQSDTADQLIEFGWVDRNTLNEIGVALKEWGEHPDAFQVETWCEAVGWKE